MYSMQNTVSCEEILLKHNMNIPSNLKMLGASVLNALPCLLLPLPLFFFPHYIFLICHCGH